MSDFAYAYFSSELDKLDVESLEEIFEKVQFLLTKKRSEDTANLIDEKEVERINSVYDKIPADEQLSVVNASMRTMWEALKNDTW